MEELQSIIEELREGNYQNFPTFYDATHRKMYFIAYGLLGTKEAAEDITQEAYAKLIISLSSYQKGTNIYAFFATIVRNLAFDELRKREHSPLLYEENEQGKDDTYHDHEEIDHYLASLKPMEREIVLYHVVEEMKFREIAQLMNKSLSSILVTYHRAMKKLRKENEDEEE